MYDKDTGRPKGFGFAEFSDADAAASAVRNLNDFDLMGRKLRVDWSNDGGTGDAAPTGYVANGQAEAPPPQQSSSLPPLPPGAELQPSLTCPDAISRTLVTLPPAQLLDILSQMRGLVMSDPVKATDLLQQAPQLSYAIFQALLLLDVVNTTVLASIIEQGNAPAQPAPPGAAGLGGLPPPPPPAASAVPQYAPPAAPAPAQPQTNQEELLKAVMAMTPEQINALPLEHRGQILALRQNLMGQAR